jgi:hypothetical protein
VLPTIFQITNTSIVEGRAHFEPFFYVVNLFVTYSCIYDKTYIFFSLCKFNFSKHFSAGSFEEPEEEDNGNTPVKSMLSPESTTPVKGMGLGI